MPWLRYFGNQTWKGIVDFRARIKSLYGLMLDNSKVGETLSVKEIQFQKNLLFQF